MIRLAAPSRGIMRLSKGNQLHRLNEQDCWLLSWCSIIRERINLALMPLAPLIAGRVIFAVMDGAERHGKLVAHLQR